MTTSFTDMGLCEQLLKRLAELKISTPTAIQNKIIPQAMHTRQPDLIGCAPTGTGKTLAFGLPLLMHLKNQPQAHALVIVPTRELAAQVLKQLRSLSSLPSALLIGGEAMSKQLRQLDKSPRLIVGTPGRINDHLERKTLSLKSSNFLVLDETDRMLDLGFSVQINRIIPQMHPQRQTLLFSATLPSNIQQLAAKYQDKPEIIRISPWRATACS